MSKILIVVDMQNDFISGTLRNSYAEKILPAVVERVKQATAEHTPIIATMDCHDPEDYPVSLEGGKLPIMHCDPDTRGYCWPKSLSDALQAHAGDGNYLTSVDKDRFAAINLIDEVIWLMDGETDIDEIELCGTVTSMCVLANALLLRAHLPNMKITVNAKLCADLTEDGQKAAFACMRNQFIDVVED